MPAAADATAERIREVNTAYHDLAAASYDSKWGIDFGDTGREQVVAKLSKALGGELGTWGHALEIGAGTGYFSLNLMAAGHIAELTATDIAPGMLEALRANADSLDLDVDTVVTDAENLPFPDESFDLVLGHAVLHHIPNLNAAAAEFFRVLRPGGLIVFCGEPSRHGDRLAMLPKLAGSVAAPAWRRLIRARPLEHSEQQKADDEYSLEPEVDVHSFSPDELRAMTLRAGFTSTRVRGEELVANLWGWVTRSMEATAEPETVPRWWRHFAFRSYLSVQKIDSRVLEPHLPPELFYNLLLSAGKAA